MTTSGAKMSRRGARRRPVAASVPNGRDVVWKRGDPTAQSASSASTTVTHVFTIAADAQPWQALVDSSADGGMRFFLTDQGKLQAYTAGSNGAYVSQTEVAFFTPGTAAVAGFEYDSVTGMIAWYGNGHCVGTDQRGGGFTLSGSGTVVVGGGLTAYERYSRCLYGSEVKAVTTRLAVGLNLDRVSASTTTPLSVRGVRGVNIMPTNNQLHADPGPWAGMWRDWDWAWMSGCVDRAALHGANVVRVIGDVQAIKAGQLTQATYLTRLTQLADYIAGKNMRLYYSGVALAQRGGVSQQELVDQFKAAAGVLEQRYVNVLGFDLCNEYGAETHSGTYPMDDATATAWMQAAANGVHQVAPHVPVSMSDITIGAGSGALARAGQWATVKKWAPYLDFFDFHAYDENPYGGQQDWHLAPYEVGCDRPMVVGEYGVQLASKGDTEGAASYTRTRTMVSRTAACAAVINWAIRNDDWGLHTEGGDVQRTATVAVFESTIPGGGAGSSTVTPSTNRLLAENAANLNTEGGDALAKES